MRNIFSHWLRPRDGAPQGEDVRNALNHVDLCFVVDTTGSMSPFLGAARAALLDTIEALCAKNDINLRLGLVEYRDHPPQEASFVTRHYALTDDLKKTRKAINNLEAAGGGDHPEAVYDGVQEAAILTEWRPHSCRFIMLVGDAPPHGYATRPTPRAEVAPEAGGARRERRRRAAVGTHHGVSAAATNGTGAHCLCGLNAAQTTAAAEEHRVVVHALPMSGEGLTVGAFTEIAKGTGGECAPATGAKAIVERIGEMLDTEFRHALFDGRVLEHALRAESLDAEQIGGALGCSRSQAASAIARLGRRGFLRGAEVAPRPVV